MALAATIVWEIRPATGGANNGGGFNSAAAGTDRSQQAAAQVVIDNAAIVCSTPGANSNTLTFDAGYTPSAADVGNIFCATAGTNINAGLYEITAQDATTWTVTGATNLTGAGGAGSAVTGNMGGARTGLSTGTTTVQSKLLGGHIVYIKNEAWNEAVALSASGTNDSMITVEGYGTTRGDGATASNRPLNDRNSAGAPFVISGACYHVKYLKATRSNGIGFSITNGPVLLIGCNSYSNATTGFTTTANGAFVGCEAYSNTTIGFSLGSTSATLFGCYSHDNTATGCTGTTGQKTHAFCIFEANASHGLSDTNTFTKLLNCTLDGNTGASTDGWNITSADSTIVMMNNIFSNNGRDGTRSTLGGLQAWADCNCYFGNAGVARTNFKVGPNDTTSDPGFANRSGGDFAVGTAMKGAGFPGVFPGGTSTGYLDIGAVQRRELGGGMYRGGLM